LAKKVFFLIFVLRDNLKLLFLSAFPKIAPHYYQINDVNDFISISISSFVSPYVIVVFAKVTADDYQINDVNDVVAIKVAEEGANRRTGTATAIARSAGSGKRATTLIGRTDVD
jgi:hypothetical protein